MQRKSFLSGGIPNRQNDLSLLKKVSNVIPKQKTMRGNNITNIIEEIKIKVKKYLGEYTEQVKSCRTEEELTAYIDICIKNGVVALDTETTGLDCLEDFVVGTCLYTPNEKAIYIPHKHKSYITGQFLQNQISYEFMKTQYQRLIDANVKIIYHNAKFDMRIVNHSMNSKLTCFWDTMIAAKLLNNLESAELKEQYAKHIKNSTKTYDFKKLFSGIEYAYTPVETAVLYAATDALITYQLYEYQQKEFEKYPRIYDVFMNEELPVLDEVCEMEDTGVALDFDKCAELSVKYNQLAKDARKDVYDELDKYKPQIMSYMSKIPNHKLSTPINIDSPTQLAILLYDIIQVGIVDKKKPRSTDKKILEKINLALCKKLLEYRGIVKLLTTYIDKMPNVVNAKDKRVHGSFNQLGTDTGRFSSSEPNLQNIPSKNDEIRTMFKATDGYALISSDFSKQEPKMLSYYTQDKNLLEAWEQNKDIYSVVASKAFNVPYEDCLEFYPKGTKINYHGKEVICGYKTHTNKEGKKRRSLAKPVLLGIMYSRGANSIAQELGITKQEAQQIINDFFKGFPAVKPWMDETNEFAIKNGYVETFTGRRRYIENIQLPEYEFSYIDNKPKDFNPLSFDSSDEYTTEVPDADKIKYTRLLKDCKGYKDKETLKQRLYSEGIKVKDNTLKFAEALRECVNSRVQGGAADQSKFAMINIKNCKELKDLGFRLLIGVHDELIGEAPIENAKRCGELLSECMTSAAYDILKIPQTCDVTITKVWYGEELSL